MSQSSFWATWQSILFSQELVPFYIYLYICMYNIYMHTHNTRTPCPVLGGSPFLFCLVLLSSAQWSHALQFSRAGCSVSHHRGSAIYIVMKVHTAAQRATHYQQKKLFVCVQHNKKEKKREPTINMTKNKKDAWQETNKSPLTAFTQQGENTYFATSVKQLKKHQHDFRTQKSPPK